MTKEKTTKTDNIENKDPMGIDERFAPLIIKDKLSKTGKIVPSDKTIKNVAEKVIKLLTMEMNAVKNGLSLEERVKNLEGENKEIFKEWGNRSDYLYTIFHKAARIMAEELKLEETAKDLYYIKPSHEVKTDLILCRVVDIPLKIKFDAINQGIKLENPEKRQEELKKVWENKKDQIESKILKNLKDNIERYEKEKRIYAWQHLCIGLSYALWTDPVDILMQEKIPRDGQGLFEKKILTDSWDLLKKVHNCSHLPKCLFNNEWVNLYRVTYQEYREFDPKITPRDFLWFGKWKALERFLGEFLDRLTKVLSYLEKSGEKIYIGEKQRKELFGEIVQSLGLVEVEKEYLEEGRKLIKEYHARNGIRSSRKEPIVNVKEILEKSLNGRSRKSKRNTKRREEKEPG